MMSDENRPTKSVPESGDGDQTWTPPDPGGGISSLLLIGLPVAIAVGVLAAWFMLRSEGRSRDGIPESISPPTEAGAAASITVAGNGMLRLLAMPPAVEVVVDGKTRGRVEASPDHPWKAQAFLLPGLGAGRHSVFIRYGAARSKTIELDISPGETVQYSISLWLPNCIVTRKDGSESFGMLREMTDGGLRLAVSPDKDVLVPMQEVSGYRLTPPVVLRGDAGVSVRGKGSDTPELTVDPFPERRRDDRGK